MLLSNFIPHEIRGDYQCDGVLKIIGILKTLHALEN